MRSQIQAVRDLYLTYKGIDSEFKNEEYDSIKDIPKLQMPVVGAISHYVLQYWRILKVHCLRNAAITTGIVALSQQLSGSESINLFKRHGFVDTTQLTLWHSTVGQHLSVLALAISQQMIKSPRPCCTT